MYVYTFVSCQGIIEALETLTLPFTIEARGVGPLVSTASFMIAGSTDPPLQLRLHCTGEGPVVSVSQEHLDWGLSPVLTPINKSLVLCNQSEIDAEFQAFLVRECISIVHVHCKYKLYYNYVYMYTMYACFNCTK